MKATAPVSAKRKAVVLDEDLESVSSNLQFGWLKLIILQSQEPLPVADRPPIPAQGSSIPRQPKAQYKRQKTSLQPILFSQEYMDQLNQIAQNLVPISARKDTKCFIHHLLDNDWFSFYNHEVIHELDQHAGRPGATIEKIISARAGTLDLSTRDDGCLVTGSPDGPHPYHMYSITCRSCTSPGCGGSHYWHVQKVAFNAAIIELNVSRDNPEQWIAQLMTDTASHLCHNSMCADPFHIVREDSNRNSYRNACAVAGSCDHSHYPPCRVNEHWPQGFSQWSQEKLRCNTVTLLPKTYDLICSASCTSRGGVPFTTQQHWKAQTSRDGRNCASGGHLIVRDNASAVTLTSMLGTALQSTSIGGIVSLSSSTSPISQHVDTVLSSASEDSVDPDIDTQLAILLTSSIVGRMGPELTPCLLKAMFDDSLFTDIQSKAVKFYQKYLGNGITVKALVDSPPSECVETTVTTNTSYRGANKLRIQWYCDDCDEEHQWQPQIHRLAMACFQIRASRNSLKWAKDLLTQETSHLCHNRSCINPWHVVTESRQTNARRNYCVEIGACTREHLPHCILD